MRKLFKKKVNVFGKNIPVFVIILLGLGLVSAALVPYLSNTVFGEVTVVSPFTLVITGVSSGVLWNGVSDSFTIAQEYAFTEQTIDVTLTNNADESIEMLIEFVTNGTTSIFSDSPGLGEEFEVYMVGREMDLITCDSLGGDYTTYTDGYCYWDATAFNNGINDGNYVYLFGGNSAGGTIVVGGDIINARMKLAFKINAEPDTYKFTAEAIIPSEAQI